MRAHQPPIDLRSDTVTRPTEAMRRAMAEAEVGDDVYGEDPTARRLEERVADLLGAEAALLTPTGTMANQIAIQLHARPGDDAIAGQYAHNWLFETGGAGALAGVQMTIVGEGGLFTGADVRGAAKAQSDHMPGTALVCVENTHNMSSGRAWSKPALDDVLAAAADLGLAAHLDGARLWNAARALGRPERELARGFDTVSVCLSKGLGTPAGSVLAGDRGLIREARRLRKRLGGGMRQAGILAAAGLHALDHHRERLAEDHENAARLARALAGAPGLSVEPAAIETNIVMIDVPGGGADELAARARERGVLANATSDKRLRLVTHLDVSAEDCDRAAEILARAAEVVAGAGAGLGGAAAAPPAE